MMQAQSVLSFLHSHSIVLPNTAPFTAGPTHERLCVMSLYHSLVFFDAIMSLDKQIHV